MSQRWIASVIHGSRPKTVEINVDIPGIVDVIGALDLQTIVMNPRFNLDRDPLVDHEFFVFATHATPSDTGKYYSVVIWVRKP